MRVHYSHRIDCSPALFWTCVLSGALALTLAIHIQQQTAYWRLADAVVREERSARQEWQKYARDLETRLAAKSGPALNAPASRPNSTWQRALPDRQMPPDGAAGGESDVKVYVYDLPAEFNAAVREDQARCEKDQYGTEIRVHEELLRSPRFRATSGDAADFFLVPIYVECFLYRATAAHGPRAGLEETNAWFLRALDIVVQDHPWWNRTEGRDHVFVFAGARGANVFKDWKVHIRKSVFLTPEGDRSLREQFNTWKDIVIPGLEHDRMFWGGWGRDSRGPQDRYLAFFRGTIRKEGKGGAAYSRGIRPQLAELATGMPDVIFSEPEDSCLRDCYHEQMLSSTFCLCPRGWSPWTLRTFQALMTGCIPVLLADGIELPYEDELDWSRITIKIPERDARRTFAILRAIPPAVVQEKRRAIDQMWRSVTWPTPSQPGDAFHWIMKALARKRRAFRASTSTSWL